MMITDPDRSESTPTAAILAATARELCEKARQVIQKTRDTTEAVQRNVSHARTIRALRQQPKPTETASGGQGFQPWTRGARGTGAG